MYVVVQNHFRFIDFFLEKGFDVNNPDANGLTCIMWACLYSSFECIYKLLYISELNLRDKKRGNTVLHHICLMFNTCEDISQEAIIIDIFTIALINNGNPFMTNNISRLPYQLVKNIATRYKLYSLMNPEMRQNRIHYSLRYPSSIIKTSIELKGVRCDNCFIQPIRGLRYKCIICEQYDLCENCISLYDHHPELITNHPLDHSFHICYSELAYAIKYGDMQCVRGILEESVLDLNSILYVVSIDYYHVIDI